MSCPERRFKDMLVIDWGDDDPILVDIHVRSSRCPLWFVFILNKANVYVFLKS